MTIKTLVVGPLDVNCYVIHYDKEAVCIDPGGDFNVIIDYITKNDLKLNKIILTHGHFDHIGASKALYDKYNADVYINENDYNLYLNVNDFIPSFMDYPPIEVPKKVKFVEDRLYFGDKYFNVIHTPGHTKGSVSYYCEEVGVIFTGDTLFKGSIGRTDLPGGDYKSIMHSIKNKILLLGDSTVIYPGHMGISTIGEEKLRNPFLY